MLEERVSWVWVYCADYLCGHARATPLVPWQIRWGENDPMKLGDMIRSNFRCTACNHRGAVIRRPSEGPGCEGRYSFPAGHEVQQGGRRKVANAWPDSDRLLARDRARRFLEKIGVRL